MDLLDEDSTMEIVMKNIYTSCDPDNSNLVPVSKLIEFITPYMMQDLSALENLRSSLDPRDTNVCVSSEKFYEVLNEWAKKIINSSDEESEFNRTPSALDGMDDKQLPYIQSTPRASFGQKLLSCEGLLNLSNVSGYSLSTNVQTRDSSLVGPEKTMLEEEIKRLEHHLNKVSNEMVIVKLQLTTTEEQNEMLQADLDRCKTRLHSEQQVIEHLQSDKKYNDDLREELNSTKRQVEELNRKLLQYEKDNNHLLGDIKQWEEENAKLEGKCEEFLRREQEAKKEIIDIKSDLDLKEQEVVTILKINDELRSKLNQQKDLIDQLTNENELLEHQKNNLGKTLRDSFTSRRESLVHQYKTCLADSSSVPNLDRDNEDECDFKMPAMGHRSSARDSLHAEISQVVQEKSNFPYDSSLWSFEVNERLLGANEEFGNVAIYKDEIDQLQMQNDSIRWKLEDADRDNDQLRKVIAEMEEKIEVLQQDVSNLSSENREKEADLQLIKEENEKLVHEIRSLSGRISELMDQNNNLSEREKSSNCTLESKSKVMAELEQNLLELKRELTSLQTANLAKERQLLEKFDFELAYKKVQMELNEKDKEIEALMQSKGELEECMDELKNSKKQLESLLEQAGTDLKKKEKESKVITSLNENITLTASQVQVHLDRKNGMINELVELNKRFESNIEKLEEELRNKITEITELQDNLVSDMEVKNIMWRDNKELKSQLSVEVKRNEELFEEIREMRDKHEEEYGSLLANYNKEVEKNGELCNQIYMYKNELSSSIQKNNEEVEKSRKLYEQVSILKREIEAIRESQEEYKVTINKKLSNYEEVIECLEETLRGAKEENEKIKNTLSLFEKKTPVKHFEADLNLSESSKSRSFEKQKITISRLQERLENVAEELLHERSRREVLEESMKDKEEKYTRTVLELEQMQCSNLLEKQQLQNTVADLSCKIKIHEERYVELHNTSRGTEETLSVKLSQFEQQNQHLFSDLRNKEFVIKNAYLEIETYKNLFKTAEQKAEELSKTISFYLFESNSMQKEIQQLNLQLAEKENKILSLSSQIAEQDIELSSVLNELTERKNTIANLEKENKSLQEMQSKSDDFKEKELLDTEQKLKNTRRLVQCSEMELSLVEKKLAESKGEYDRVCDEVTRQEDVIRNGRMELVRASDLVFSKWNDMFEEEIVYGELIRLRDLEGSEKGGEIFMLDNKIRLAVLLLELFATKAPTPMEGTDYGINSLLNVKANANQYSQSDVKMIKKFTLRPSRLVVNRPVSPDSPSVTVEDTRPETPQEINFNTSKEIYISPDSNVCQLCPHCADDSFKTALDEFSFTKDDTIELTPFQDSFPNVSDTFLEKLGLHEGSLKQNLTRAETEELFATLAIQIALDCRDVKERMQKQKDRCVDQHDRFLSLVRDVSCRLRDHKCIGAADPISPVFVLLEDMKFLFRDLTRSAEQFGILICENRMMKCWNLVTNYMALLKQDVVSLRAVESTQKNEQQVGAITSFGAKFRKRITDFNKTDEINCSSSVSSSENAETCRNRHRYYTYVKNSAMLTFVMIFLALILLISVHWQCRMTANENQVCVLDDFIKKIHIGNPPY